VVRLEGPQLRIVAAPRRGAGTQSRVVAPRRPLVADIGAVYGKTVFLTQETMLFCLFKHAAAQSVRDLIVRAGERVLIKRPTLRALQPDLGEDRREDDATHPWARCIQVGSDSWSPLGRPLRLQRHQCGWAECGGSLQQRHCRRRWFTAPRSCAEVVTLEPGDLRLRDRSQDNS
jgi:hypothetical protein